MTTAVSIALGVVGLLFLCTKPAWLGVLLLFISMLVFIRGNRLKRERREESRHQELREAIRKDREGQ